MVNESGMEYGGYYESEIESKFAELQERLDWILLRLKDARANFDKGLLRQGLEQQDFNGFLAGIEWIATGQSNRPGTAIPALPRC